MLAIEVEVSRRLRRFGGAASLACLARRGVPEWPWTEGVYLLVRWAGELIPYPRLTPNGVTRCAEIVGMAAAGDEDIREWAGMTATAPNMVHWYTVIAAAAGGAWHGIRPGAVWPRATDSGGADVGLLPATPSDVEVTLMPGRYPVLRWTYATVYESARATTFRVFRTPPSGGFNFSAPHATVQAIPGRRRYEWVGAALSTGDAYCYTVRAVTEAGVRSLTPRYGATPSPLYDDARPLVAALLRVSTAAPPAITEHRIEEVQ